MACGASRSLRNRVDSLCLQGAATESIPARKSLWLNHVCATTLVSQLCTQKCMEVVDSKDQVLGVRDSNPRFLPLRLTRDETPISRDVLMPARSSILILYREDGN